MRCGLVYLVGAGPGDPKLITVKGLECVKRADCIVYDRLVNYKLLSYVRPEAELIYVGKSPHNHTYTQEEINRLLVQKAKEGKRVTRLKGGDPFVFGRGGEEAEFLRENGVSFRIVPGISSSVAVPAYAGIPVTHRNATSSVTIITGNQDPMKDEQENQIEKLVVGDGTLVFLMGVTNLETLMQKLISAGRSLQTPVALIQWGTYQRQQVVTGDLTNIVDKVATAGIKPPAVIVVGEVVNLREKLSWFDNTPLFNKKVLLARSTTRTSNLADLLEEQGAEVWEFPKMTAAWLGETNSLDCVIYNIDYYDSVFFTTKESVQFFLTRSNQLGFDIRGLYGIRLWVTEEEALLELRQYGLRAELVDQKNIMDLTMECPSCAKDDCNALFLTAEGSNHPLTAQLRRLNVAVTEVGVYQENIDELNFKEIKKMLINQEFDIVSFCSSNSVKLFANLLTCLNLPRVLENTTVASIGNNTAMALKERGISVDVIPAQPTLEDLVEALSESRIDAKIPAKEAELWMPLTLNY